MTLALAVLSVSSVKCVCMYMSTPCRCTGVKHRVSCDDLVCVLSTHLELEFIINPLCAESQHLISSDFSVPSVWTANGIEKDNPLNTEPVSFLGHWMASVQESCHFILAVGYPLCRSVMSLCPLCGRVRVPFETQPPSPPLYGHNQQLQG